MRVAITGGRGVTGRVTNEFQVFRHLDLHHAKTPITVIIEGGQRTVEKNTKKIIGGVDFWASKWAYSKGVGLITEPAKWNDFSDPCILAFRPNGTRYNKVAGPKRNALIMDFHKPDILIAFPGGSGTANAIYEAKKRGIPVLEIPYEQCNSKA